MLLSVDAFFEFLPAIFEAGSNNASTQLIVLPQYNSFADAQFEVAWNPQGLTLSVHSSHSDSLSALSRIAYNSRSDFACCAARFLSLLDEPLSIAPHPTFNNWPWSFDTSAPSGVFVHGVVNNSYVCACTPVRSQVASLQNEQTAIFSAGNCVQIPSAAHFSFEVRLDAIVRESRGSRNRST